MGVNATVLNSTAINVQWLAPANAFGIIREYVVSIRMDSAPVMDYTVDGDDLMLVVAGLSPATEYTIVVYARTVELGVPTGPVTVRTDEDGKLLPRCLHDKNVICTISCIYVYA